jgi:pimeloyl-ACP methyl ester carboxylesterase
MVVRESDGPQGGSAILYIHGLGESGLCFEGLIRHPELAAFRHLVPDLPGYGRSPWPARTSGLAELADGLAAWLARRGESDVTVVGHSMGGVVGLLLAERSRQSLRRLVNVDGNVAAADCSFSGEAAAMDLASFAAGGFDRLRQRVFEGASRDVALRGYYVSLRLADPASFHRHSRELVELSSREELASRLARLQVPLTYVAGSPGGASPRSLELLDAAGVETRLVAPAGHWPFVDQPDRFVNVLTDLL